MSDISDVSDELRFSLEEYSESEQDDIVAVLQVSLPVSDNTNQKAPFLCGDGARR